VTGLARRDFLRVALGAAGSAPLFAGKTTSCILLVLTGGPSHLDTWDMKPDAPSDVRGPFRPIRTNVPGIEISEIFPRMAKHADKFALIRSVHSDGAPVHEDGLRAIDAATAENITLPGAIGFARSCRRARQLVEAGVPFVRVNMFDTVFHRATWDSHGTRPFSTFRDYKDTVGPAFDIGYSTLLEDLSQRGLLATTLVIAMGEFGRTPRINPSGGRDHWTKCWTVLLAGGGVQGGQVYGSSDATGAEPRDNPVHIESLLSRLPGHAVDLDFDVRHKAADDGGSRGLRGAEELRVDLVHRREVFAIGDVDADAHDVGQGRARAFQNKLHVVDRDAGFVPDVAARKLVGRGIDRDLA